MRTKTFFKNLVVPCMMIIMLKVTVYMTYIIYKEESLLCSVINNCLVTYVINLNNETKCHLSFYIYVCVCVIQAHLGILALLEPGIKMTS